MESSSFNKVSGTGMEQWLKNLVPKLHAIIEEKILKLNSIIRELGIDETSKAEWETVIKQQIVETFDQLIEDAQDMQTRVTDQIEKFLKKSETLCKLLQVEMPPYGSDDLPFFQELQLLKMKVAEFERAVNIRTEEFNQLRRRELTACECLGRDQKQINDSPLPSPSQIEEFVDYVKQLELEIFEREDRFLNLKCKIVEIAKHLEVKPMLELEKLVLTSDDSSFKVTDYNMRWIEEYYTSLQTEQKQIKLEIERLIEQVKRLWEMLSEDIKMCNDFLQTHVGTSRSSLQAWKTEWRRCEDLKKANIERFVKELRTDLVTLWNKCHKTDTERNKFEYLHCTIYTEELLTFHDMEIQELKMYYEQNKEMFILLDKWRKSWNKMLELEENASAPNRLKNRGGTLLKEERERNLLLKRLPGYESRLMELATNYKHRTGQTFLSWGETIPDLIENARGSYKEQKDSKLSARKQQRDHQVVTPGPSTTGLVSAVSGSRLNLHTQRTPTSKRPMLMPLSSNKRKNKENIPKIKVNGRRLSSMERQKRLRKIRKSLKNSKRAAELPCDDEEYDVFEQGISMRVACRSTLCETFNVVSVPQTPRSTKKTRNQLVPTATSRKLIPMAGSTLDI